MERLLKDPQHTRRASAQGKARSASDEQPEADEEQDLPQGSVHAREKHGDEDDRPEFARDAGSQDGTSELGRKEVRIREDGNERAECRRRERDTEEPPGCIDSRLLQRGSDEQTNRERDPPPERAPSKGVSRDTVLDDFEPGEEEQEGQAEVREKRQVLIDRRDVEDLGPD